MTALLPLAGCSLAFATDAATVGKAQVGPGQRVAALAVRFTRVPSRRTGAAHVVFPWRDGFKMVGVDACPIAAQVIDVVTVRDGPVRQAIRHAVGGLGLAFANGEAAVPVVADVACPFPAHFEASRRISPLPEARRHRLAALVRIAVLVPTQVMFAAIAASEDSRRARLNGTPHARSGLSDRKSVV